jgi:N-acetyl-anhydromuramyl-L-alanine amidase AmpD
MKREVDHIIVHCAATPPTSDIGAADIDRWHRAKGWWGNGYHYVIRRDGEIEAESAGKRCRPLEKPGAHVGGCGPGWNKRSIGICLVGGIDEEGNAEDNFTTEQFDSLKDLVEYLRRMFPDTKIMGHRDLIKLTGASPKSCPSFEVSDWLRHVGIDPQ